MTEKEKLLNNLLSARTEFGKAKQEYKDAISDFLGDAVKYIHINFHGNKMYVTFESFCPFDNKFLLKFCNEFGFLAPTMESQKLHRNIIVYSWKFIKILD